MIFPSVVGIPGILTAGADIGKLEGLQGGQPTLTMALPGDQGRLRFLGKVLSPNQTFPHLAFEKKGEVVCKDEEAQWLGTKEGSPHGLP